MLETIKADKTIKAGDVTKIMPLVESKIMPNVNFQRMTASAVGPAWRQATPEQQKRLQEEFKTLLARTYAGALDQVSDQTVSVRPFRGSPDDNEVLVRTEVKGDGDPVQLDYRLEKTPARRRLEDLQHQRPGRVAGRYVPHPVRAADQHQGHRRPDRCTSAARNKSNGKSRPGRNAMLGSSPT